MTRKTEIGYYALLVVLAIGSLRFGQLMWQQQQTLSHLHKQAKLATSQVLANDYLFPEVGGTADYIDNNGLKSSSVV
ncbi:hypothetical protein [Leuconostoc gasicomitatum]|uniref:hypothetical protein n=1 Tax=Leuconostoc gasicomitatum TaxID=115778 RepID=UPI0007DF3C10|nr:hypothetical protein [Leuconostoc gasicomitatum]CUW16195.1 hypothetical protein PB1E_1876 [Leuconostoc gasicomitatum]